MYKGWTKEYSTKINIERKNNLCGSHSIKAKIFTKTEHSYLQKDSSNKIGFVKAKRVHIHKKIHIYRRIHLAKRIRFVICTRIQISKRIDIHKSIHIRNRIHIAKSIYIPQRIHIHKKIHISQSIHTSKNFGWLPAKILPLLQL